jgi:hypothetical protein
MPALGGATGWLNSEPLSPPELRGHVVLVNFCTLTCINWLRQEPYIRAWSQAYRADGLVVIGVHTPEFSFEHQLDRVRQATTERGIDYPVAVDNDYAIWRAFDNHYWPALYFVDTDGRIGDQHFGEGRYEQSERVIQRLLGIQRELVSVQGVGVEAEADWEHLRTPETYLGYGRGDQFASPVIGPSGVFVIDSKQWSGQVHQSSDGLVWHNHYRLDRTLETVCWQAETLGRLLGIPAAPLLCVHGAHIQGGGLCTRGVAIVPAGRLRAALGHGQVLADANVELLAATARTRLHPAV